LFRPITRPLFRPLFAAPNTYVKGGGLPPLLAGYAFLIDDDGSYVLDDDGSYIIVEA
jgi:hypothetical protein